MKRKKIKNEPLSQLSQGGKKPWNGSKQAFPSTSPPKCKRNRNVRDDSGKYSKMENIYWADCKIKVAQGNQKQSKKVFIVEKLAKNVHATVTFSCKSLLRHLTFLNIALSPK